MDTDIEIAPYEGGHKEQVLRLQQHLWGRDAALNRAYFQWKYEDNPYIPHPAICLALHRGEVVGMRGLVGAKWQLGTSGRTHVIPFTDDFVIAPGSRDRGIASALIHAACEYADNIGCRFLLSLRAGPVNLLASLAAGYRSIGAMKPVGLIGDQRDPFHLARRRLEGRRFVWRFANSPLLRTPASHRPFRVLDRGAKGPGARGGSQVSIGGAPLPDAMAELVERLPPDDRIHHVRDRQYFDWVFRNPRLDYRFLYRYRDRLDGYLVLHRELPPRPGPVSVWISDWDGTSDEIRRELLAAAASGRFARNRHLDRHLPDIGRDAAPRVRLRANGPRGARARPAGGADPAGSRRRTRPRLDLGQPAASGHGQLEVSPSRPGLTGMTLSHRQRRRGLSRPDRLELELVVRRVELRARVGHTCADRSSWRAPADMRVALVVGGVGLRPPDHPESVRRPKTPIGIRPSTCLDRQWPRLRTPLPVEAPGLTGRRV